MSSTDYGDMKNPRGIIGYFASNLVAANLIMGLLLVGGLFAGLSLNSQIFPSVDPGIISVSVPYPGATPTEVEEGITRRAEEAVFGIEGVERVVSESIFNAILSARQVKLAQTVRWHLLSAGHFVQSK